MELEYKDDRRKGRFVILAGVILALVAGGIAFYTISQAQQKANDPTTNKISLVVAVATIPAREPVKAADVTVREVPLDPTNANGVITDANLVIGRIAAVTILQGQLVTTNMLASATEGAPFSILDPRRELRPRHRSVARHLDHRLRRPRGRRDADRRRERRRVRHDRGQPSPTTRPASTCPTGRRR